ncbi:hypothetical protein QMZ65_24885 [Pantoea sp. EABMAA-21]|uniref:hypothetical protein n=2 Tax=unclassified Pantoea TaxID=2630326 RepID=UPI0024B4B03D|nr:hypothetical protein [Pantoea sp. EABMAA-21]MDI9280453.1 hypothetical protein [Pantoea sp. EABMAA-21]
MSAKHPPAAENALSKKDGNTVNAHHTSCQCYFRPETTEVIFLDESDSGEFDDLTSKLSELMDRLEKARVRHSAAIEAYYKKRNDIASQEALPAYFDAVVSTEIEAEKATEALQKEVGEFDEQAGYAGLVELIPLEPLKKGIYGRFYCYMKKTDYEAFSGRMTVISLNNLGAEDFYQRDKDGNIIAISTKAIRERFQKVIESLTQMSSGKTAFGAEGTYEASLTEWAEAWNGQDGYAAQGRVIDVSAGAQFLRFSSNAGAQLDWNRKENAGIISGEAEATLTLAEAHVKATFYQPDRGGWQLKFIINDENKEANLGVLRSRIDTGLTGFAGASARIEGNLQFVVSDGQQKLMGVRAPYSRFALRQKGVMVDTEKETSAATSVRAELFAGVSAGGTFGGALQWLKPFESLVDHLPDMLRTFGMEASISDTKVLDKVLSISPKSAASAQRVGKFTDFAAFIAGGELQAGLGGSGEYEFWFEDGKFKFRISGGVCLGVGAKGSAQGEVTPHQFTEFAVWAVYQLYGMDYRYFKVFAKDAFKALTLIVLMGGKSIYENYYNKMKATYYTVSEDFDDFIKNIKKNLSNAAEASDSRNQFAEQINNNPSEVYHFTPEGKGISIYLLIQGGMYDRIDPSNHKLASLIDNSENGLLPIPDTAHQRKKAVLTILSSIQTKREWAEVLIRMTGNGEKVAGAPISKLGQARLIKQQEELIRTALQIGINQDHRLNEMIKRLELQDFREVYRRLKEKPAFGYPFAPNCTKQYALYCDDNPWYASLCHIAPANPVITNALNFLNK